MACHDAADGDPLANTQISFLRELTMPDAQSNSNEPTLNRHWYQRVGPGLITACVVIGPGSILTSSKVGAGNGYSMSWVVIVAAFFMMIYMTLGAKLGVVSGRSTGTIVTECAGRWLAVLIGISVFFISTAFQFGNNLGVHAAFALYVDFKYMVVIFNAISIAFLLGFKNLYRAVERLMMTFVALMLVSFAVNVLFARPNVGELLAGLIPNTNVTIDLSVLGLIGTTFVVAAAYFQSYLVQQKKWGRKELKSGLIDARIGSVIMGLITFLLMWTAAAGLRGENLASVTDVAQGLSPLFGGMGQPIFCIGLFAAAYSSFLVNSMIAGFILSDGLGLGSTPEDRWPRIITVCVLLTGMSIALLVIRKGFNPVPAIVAAQAVTVIAGPLVAGILIWLTNRKDVMGDDCNGPLMNLCAGIGFLLLLAMAYRTAFISIPERLEKLRQPEAQASPIERETQRRPDSSHRTSRHVFAAFHEFVAIRSSALHETQRSPSIPEWRCTTNL